MLEEEKEQLSMSKETLILMNKVATDDVKQISKEISTNREFMSIKNPSNLIFKYLSIPFIVTLIMADLVLAKSFNLSIYNIEILISSLIMSGGFIAIITSNIVYYKKKDFKMRNPYFDYSKTLKNAKEEIQTKTNQIKKIKDEINKRNIEINNINLDISLLEERINTKENPKEVDRIDKYMSILDEYELKEKPKQKIKTKNKRS